LKFIEWSDKTKQRSFISELIDNQFSKETLYSIQTREIENYGGRKLLSLYDRCIPSLITSLFPSHSWDLWRFKDGPTFLNASQQRLFFLHLSNTKNMVVPEDLNTIKRCDIRNECELVLKLNENMVSQCLFTSFPEFTFKAQWRVTRAPFGFWKKPERQREYLMWLCDHLKFIVPYDLTTLKLGTFTNNGGASLLANHFNNSPFLCVKTMVPEIEWKMYEFSCVSNGFWENFENHRQIFCGLEAKLRFCKKEDWYGISSAELRDIGLNTLLSSAHYSSLFKALCSIFPYHFWHPWRFKDFRVWESSNLRLFLHAVGKELGYLIPSQYYDQEPYVIESKRHWKSWLYHFSSVCDGVMKLFPEFVWTPWKFIHTHNLWKREEMRKKYFEWLFNELKLKSKEDWYAVSMVDIRKRYGKNLILNYYKNSLGSALASLWPTYHWKFWLFSPIPLHMWQNASYTLRYLNWLAVKIGLNVPEDWYRIEKEKFIQNYGSTLIFSNQYENTHIVALVSIFSEFEWDIPRLISGKKGDKQTIVSSIPSQTKREELEKHYRNSQLHSIASTLNIQNMEEWERVSISEIRAIGKTPVATTISELHHLLLESHRMKDSSSTFLKMLERRKKAKQRLLYSHIKRVFEGKDCHEDYLLPTHLSTTRSKELDIFVSRISVAFEYQGEHHYIFGNKKKTYLLADIEKEKLCKKLGITLFHIPFWWNCEVELLCGTIYEKRRDLFSSEAPSLMQTTIPKKAPDYIVEQLRLKGDIYG